MSPAGASSVSSVTGSRIGIIPVSSSAVVTQIVLVPDIGGYSTCSMITNPASASGCVGGQHQVAVRRRIAARLAQHALAQAVLVPRQVLHLLEHRRPGTSRTPPTITRPGSPQAWRSTAEIMEERRMIGHGRFANRHYDV